jgi:hypothetical protein
MYYYKMGGLQLPKMGGLQLPKMGGLQLPKMGGLQLPKMVDNILTNIRTKLCQQPFL